MSSGMPWFRFYNETLGDRKIAYIAQETGQPKGIIMGLWSTILTIASSSPQRGILLFTENKPITIQHLCFETGFDIELVTELLEALLGMELLSIDGTGIYSVTNWGKRQFTSDHSTERVRKHRESKNGNGDETEGERFSNVSETDQIQITDSEPNTDSDTEKDILAVPQKIREIQALTIDAIKKKKLKASEWEQLLAFEECQKKPRKGLVDFINKKLANGNLSPEQSQYLALFGATRFSNPTQARTVQETITAHGLPLVIEVGTWAANSDIPLGKAISGLKKTAANWSSKQKRGGTNESHRQNSRPRAGENRTPLPPKYDSAEVERNRKLLEEHRARMSTVQGDGGEST